MVVTPAARYSLGPVYDIWDNPQGLMQQFTVHDVDFMMKPEDLDKVLEPGHDGIGWLAQQGDVTGELTVAGEYFLV